MDLTPILIIMNTLLLTATFLSHSHNGVSSVKEGHTTLLKHFILK